MIYTECQPPLFLKNPHSIVGVPGYHVIVAMLKW